MNAVVGTRKTKVILAKMGLDIHSIGVDYVAYALRDAGMEVVYMGLYNRADAIVRTALEEDASVIGISFLAAGHLRHISNVMQLLKQLKDPPAVMVGGIIPRLDIPQILDMGVAKVFLPGTTRDEIVDFIDRQQVKNPGGDGFDIPEQREFV